MLGLASKRGSSFLRHCQYLRNASTVTLTKNRPVYQIVGANTDIGKTVISSGLCLTYLQRKEIPSYIKPIQTGPTSDAAFILDQVAKFSKAEPETIDQLKVQTLYGFGSPVSPHIAAEQDGNIVSDKDIIASIEAALREETAGPASAVLLEGAGGVLSPGPSGTPQADLFRALRLPCLLVGDGRLGGISATAAAREALLLRGYSVPVLITIRDAGDLDLGHEEYFRRRLAGPAAAWEGAGEGEGEGGRCRVVGLPPLPPPEVPLGGWYAAAAPGLAAAADAMAKAHRARLAALARARDEAAGGVWWPFTQHRGRAPGQTLLVDSALGDDLQVVEPGPEDVAFEKVFDGCASWWTQGWDRGGPALALAAGRAAGRYGHVIFPGAAHAPALALARAALRGPARGWGARVFFSDNGSTAVEVALKMAFRKYQVDHGLPWGGGGGTGADQEEGGGGPPPPRLVALAQRDSYHGDTLGCMDLSEPSVFNQGQQPWYEARNLSLPLPTLAWRDGQYTVAMPESCGDNCLCSKAAGGGRRAFASEEAAFDLAARLRGDALAGTYRACVAGAIDRFERGGGAAGPRRRLGACVLEPVLLGAGGMKLADPLFQRVLVEECRSRRIPVVYDEVFSGLWRLGVEASSDILGIHPDISCYAKLLTGGLLPLSLTVASKDVFEAFDGDTKAEALLHGHSYTAHPIGCSVACASLKMYKQSPNYDAKRNRMLEFWDQNDVIALSKLTSVRSAMRIGTVVAVELESTESGYASNASQQIVEAMREDGVYLRPLGNVIYIMVSPFTNKESCKMLLSKLAIKLS